jgi:hypothetical protein
MGAVAVVAAVAGVQPAVSLRTMSGIGWTVGGIGESGPEGASVPGGVAS